MAALALGIVAWGEHRYDLVVATTMGLTTLSLMHIVGRARVPRADGDDLHALHDRQPPLRPADRADARARVPRHRALAAPADLRHGPADELAVGHLPARAARLPRGRRAGKLYDRHSGAAPGRSRAPPRDPGRPVLEVSGERIPDHAERLVTRPVALRDLALAFSGEQRRRRRRCSWRAAASTRRCSRTSRPRGRRSTSTSSASGPGRVGDAFADALIAKAAEGVPVRLVVDRQGSDPERGARDHYDRLTAAGSRSASCVGRRRARRAECSGARRPCAGTSRARPHRPSQGRGRRRPDRLGRRRGDRGSLRGRPLPRSLRPRDRPGRRAAPARVPRELPLARREVPVAALDALFPRLEAGEAPVPARVLHNAPGPFRPITDRDRARCSTARRRRSTSSTRT